MYHPPIKCAAWENRFCFSVNFSIHDRERGGKNGRLNSGISQVASQNEQVIFGQWESTGSWLKWRECKKKKNPLSFQLSLLSLPLSLPSVHRQIVLEWSYISLNHCQHHWVCPFWTRTSSWLTLFVLEQVESNVFWFRVTSQRTMMSENSFILEQKIALEAT